MKINQFLMFLKKNRKKKFLCSLLFSTISMKNHKKSPKFLYIYSQKIHLTRVKMREIEKFQKIRKFQVICNISSVQVKIRGATSLGEKLVSKIVLENYIDFSLIKIK